MKANDVFAGYPYLLVETVINNPPITSILNNPLEYLVNKYCPQWGALER